MPTEDELKTHLAKNPMLIKRFIKMFELMDGRCRALAMSKPNRNMSDYCEKCQKMFKEVYYK